MMDEVLMEHRGYCRWYIDDIIIFSKTKEEHQKPLRRVFGSLNRAELKVTLGQSSLFKKEVVFRGRRIDGFTKSTKEESAEKDRNITDDKHGAGPEVPWTLWTFSRTVKARYNEIIAATNFPSL